MVKFGGMGWVDWIVLIGTVAAIYTIVGDPAIRGPYAVSVLAATLTMFAAYFLLKKSKYIKNSLAIPAVGIIAYFVVNSMPWTKAVRFEMLDATGGPYGSTTTLPTYWILGLLAIFAIYVLETKGVINLKKYLPF
jgi:ABC-type enterochelin transport system permease subunit